jgi:hypothetical protein
MPMPQNAMTTRFASIVSGVTAWKKTAQTNDRGGVNFEGEAPCPDASHPGTVHVKLELGKTQNYQVGKDKRSVTEVNVELKDPNLPNGGSINYFRLHTDSGETDTLASFETQSFDDGVIKSPNREGDKSCLFSGNWETQKGSEINPNPTYQALHTLGQQVDTAIKMAETQNPPPPPNSPKKK